MNTSFLLNDLQKNTRLIELLEHCYRDRLGLEALQQEYARLTILPELVNYTGYRYIMLSEGLEDERHLHGRWPQLDWSALKQPFRSWAKTTEGAKYFAQEFKGSSRYQILVKGEFKGFCLNAYALKVIHHASAFLKANQVQLRGVKELEEGARLLNQKVALLEEDVDSFSREEEIVPVEEITLLEFLEGQVEN